MIRVLSILLLMEGAALAVGPAKIPLDEFHTRRAALRADLEGGVLFLKGQAEPNDRIFRFEQEPNFYYLTGWSEPGAALLLTPTDEILFLPSHNARAEKYSGKRTAAEDADARAATGFDTVLPIEKLESELDRALSSHARLYAPWTEYYTTQLRTHYPFRDVADATPLIAKLRLKKSRPKLRPSNTPPTSASKRIGQPGLVLRPVSTNIMSRPR